MRKEINFSNLTFNDFRKLAVDPSLTRHEKVGFPNEYREGKEEAIFTDICEKLHNLSLSGKTVVEIGPGCSNLPLRLAEMCEQRNNKLIFFDSEEMLSHLPDAPHITKINGSFPEAARNRIEKFIGRIDVILAYSVIQYTFSESNLWDFIDYCLILLSDGGEILLADIPNITMRKRFFSSRSGIQFHRDYTGGNDAPVVKFNQPEPGQIDDSVVMSLVHRARAQGFHAWVVPQSPLLPMANRREDILIRKP